MISFESICLPAARAAKWEFNLTSKAPKAAFDIVRLNSYFDRTVWPNQWRVMESALPALIAAGFPVVIDGVYCKYASKIADRVLKTAWPEHWALYQENNLKLDEISKECVEEPYEKAQNRMREVAETLTSLFDAADALAPDKDINPANSYGYFVGANQVASTTWDEVSHEHFVPKVIKAVLKTPELEAAVAEFISSVTELNQLRDKRANVWRQISSVQSSVKVTEEMQKARVARQSAAA